MNLSSTNLPDIKMAQTQQQHLQLAKQAVYASKGGEKQMNKLTIAVSGVAIASIVAVAVYAPLSQKSTDNPVIGQFVQSAHAQELIAQAESQVAQMSKAEKQSLDELFKGDVGAMLGEAKQASDLAVLSADEVIQLEQRVLNASTISIMSGASNNMANYVHENGQLDASLTILSYTVSGDEVFLALDEQNSPVFRLVVRP